MKKLLVLVCLVGLLSCVSSRPTEVDYVNTVRKAYPAAEIYKYNQYHDYVVVEGITVRLVTVSMTVAGTRIYRVEELPRYEKTK